MTQIISQLCRAFALQVEDRLVTQTAAGSAPRKFDALANKNVIYWARDAIVSIGYTGLAYVKDLPTDDWIAATLTGLDVAENFAIRNGPLPRWWDIGQAIDLLCRELKASEIAARKDYFELEITGWQWKKGKRPLIGSRQPVPLGCSIRKAYGKDFEVKRLPRHWYWKPGAQFGASPEGGLSLSLAEIQQLAERMHSLPDSQYEQAIVDAIRSVAARNPDYVGPNCMSVLIAPPHIRALVQITFFPQERHTARLVSSKFVSPEYLAAYSPWIIGNGLVQKPSVFIGDGWEFHMGPFTVLLKGFPAGPGLLAGMSSQRRPARAIR
jgi:hypothetical protein